jgi:hypothetical protein
MSYNPLLYSFNDSSSTTSSPIAESFSLPPSTPAPPIGLAVPPLRSPFPGQMVQSENWDIDGAGLGMPGAIPVPSGGGVTGQFQSQLALMVSLPMFYRETWL